MEFRWTMEQLKEWSDNKILRGLVAERVSGLNPYTPLTERLNKIYNKLDEEVQKENK